MNTKTYLHIAEPCHENWNEMNPVEQGRFCLSCSKTVVDFTGKSDKEILAIISRASSSTCGRFRNEQLQRPLEQPASLVLKPLKLAAAAMIPIAIITSSADAQTTKGEIGPKKEVEASPQITAGLVLVVNPKKVVKAKPAVTEKAALKNTITKPYTNKMKVQPKSGIHHQIPAAKALTVSLPEIQPASIRDTTIEKKCMPIGKDEPLNILSKHQIPEQKQVTAEPSLQSLLKGQVGTLVVVKTVSKPAEFKTMVQKITGTQVFKVFRTRLHEEWSLL